MVMRWKEKADRIKALAENSLVQSASLFQPCLLIRLGAPLTCSE
jgi:hypothetical protein